MPAIAHSTVTLTYTVEVATAESHHSDNPAAAIQVARAAVELRDLPDGTRVTRRPAIVGAKVDLR